MTHLDPFADVYIPVAMPLRLRFKSDGGYRDDDPGYLVVAYVRWASATNPNRVMLADGRVEFLRDGSTLVDPWPAR